MTYFDTQAPVRKILPAILAGIALFLTGGATIGGVNVMGHQIGFAFVPLLIVTIWPRSANTLLSLLIVFFAGLFIDWANAGILGQWALILCVTWGVLRPELRNAPFAPLRVLFIWISICGLAFVLLSVSGMFVYGILPDFAALVRQMILATILLPVSLLLRHLFSVRFGSHESWGV